MRIVEWNIRAGGVVGAMHVPNRLSGRKCVFHDAVLACASRWRPSPAVLVGDTNSGRRGIDEETAVFSDHAAVLLDAANA